MDYGVFPTRDVSRITGFTVRQLDYWARQGIIVPSIQQSCGSGSRRLYSIGDLVRLRFIGLLKGHGWSTQKVRTAITKLREVMDDPNPLGNALLFDGKGTMLALCKTKSGDHILIDALRSGGQQVMEIVLETLEEDARRAISQFAPALLGESKQEFVQQREHSVNLSLEESISGTRRA